MEGGLPLRSQYNVILCLVVGRKQPRRQFRSTVWALNLKPLLVPVDESVSHHMFLIGRL